MSSSGPGCERGERSHAMPCSRVRCHNMWRKRRRFFKYKWRQCLLVFARWQSRVHRVISWLNARLARTSHFKCNKVFLPWVQQSLTSIKLNLMAYHYGMGQTCVTGFHEAYCELESNQITASMTTMLELQNCTEFSIYFVWPQIFAIHNNLLLHEASKQWQKLVRLDDAELGASREMRNSEEAPSACELLRPEGLTSPEISSKIWPKWHQSRRPIRLLTYQFLNQGDTEILSTFNCGIQSTVKREIWWGPIVVM